ncbi:hypothetical protein PIB30_006831 [Stylosanthes scabra]|uniref:TF-B3 domain-containing protein n=1 Tax=Stylosanthes scabra TaxID=79078 RepID=A0ABU6V535_9FABA|nr:hypothetical protein [Stylosanthes scabra]
MKCTLFGDFVGEALGYLEKTDVQPLVLVGQLFKPHVWLDDVNVQTSFYGSRVFFNPTFLDAAEFRNGCRFLYPFFHRPEREAKDQVNADRSKETGRFLSTNRYWPKESKKDIFHVKLMKHQLYATIKVEFLLELRYIKWGLFYVIVWNEQFDEVVPRIDKNLYVKDIFPTWILDLISEGFKLSYLDGHPVANYGVTSTLNKTSQIQRKTPSTLKRNLGSTSASTSKKRQTPNKATATRIFEVMTITKTLTSSDAKTTRLSPSSQYMPAEFTQTMAKAGVNTTWYVIGPPIDRLVKNFRFKLLPSIGRKTELKIGGQWQKFCLTYDLKEGSLITIKIKSIEERTMHITIT